MTIKLLDCTLRDGGYYNQWDFSSELVKAYLEAMVAIKADFVEIGFRSIKNQGFKGGFAFSTDTFLNSLNIPIELENKIGVMINASELVNAEEGFEKLLEKLFTDKAKSPVSLVRIACHVHEFEEALLAVDWLKAKGYKIGFNLMQIADKSDDIIEKLAKKASQYPLDVLYFADSMGSLNPKQVQLIVEMIQNVYHGEIGIHTHDNMSQAIVNSKEAVDAGVTWVDSTVTGMGRGPGNAQTEYVTIALAPYRKEEVNNTKLLASIRHYFKPLQDKHRWGTNPYYYLAGEYGLHPSYIQAMLSDSRYDEEDILAVIKHLKCNGGKKFSFSNLESARHFYSGEPRGSWCPSETIQNRDVLILGTGPGVAKYKKQIEQFIEDFKPIVIALNTQQIISENLISFRAACHPVRLLADCKTHLELEQPLIAPSSMLPEDIRVELEHKKILDYGINIQVNSFIFGNVYSTLPTSLVIGYTLAIATSGKANKILLAGFDGYPAGDPRNDETTNLFETYMSMPDALELTSITPTKYRIPTISLYGLTKEQK